MAALAWRRVRRRSSGALLAAGGIAVGTAVLIGVLAGTKIAQDRSVAQAVERIPAASRSVRAVWFGVPVGASQTYPAIDESVRSKLGRLGLPGPTAIVLFRESTVAGHFVSLAGVEGLAPLRQADERTAPTPVRAATAARSCGCAGTGTLPDAPGLRLVEVGTATLRSSQLFGDFLAPTDNALEDREVAPALQQGAAYHRPPPAPLVVAEGIDVLTRAPAVANTYRSYAWVWPLAAGPAAALADRRPRRRERARPGCALGCVDRLQRAGPRRGAARSRACGHRRPAGGSCSSAARRPHCSSRSRYWRPGACGAISRLHGAGSPGTGRDAGSCGS